MIFALGTPINARFKPWAIPGMLLPDGLMISVVDFFRSKKLLKDVRKKGIREVLSWDGLIICDSGAFTAINSKNTINISVDDVKSIYRELFSDDDAIIKISLDFPSDKILEHYKILHSVDVQPAVPHDQIDLLRAVLEFEPNVEWIFIGRLVPLMRKGRNQVSRLKVRLDVIKQVINEFYWHESPPKLWTLGLGAPSMFDYLIKNVDGADSSRWRVSGSNMILMPNGGERGVGNRTKWLATHRRIREGEEKLQVVRVLRELFSRCDNLLEYIPKLVETVKIPEEWIQDGPSHVKKRLSGRNFNLLLEKILFEDVSCIHPLELEVVLRSSSRLRLLFNYHVILKRKMEKERDIEPELPELEESSMLRISK